MRHSGLIQIVLPLLGLHLVTLTSATIYFFDSFRTKTQWIESTSSLYNGIGGKSDFELSPGVIYENAEKDQGLYSPTDRSYYATSAKFEQEILDLERDIVIQFEHKFEQPQWCGGAYVKLIGAQSASNLASFNKNTEYQIMFGPDACSVRSEIRVILPGKGEQKLSLKRSLFGPFDIKTHLYRLSLFKDKTYAISIDNEVMRSGAINEDFTAGKATLSAPSEEKYIDNGFALEQLKNIPYYLVDQEDKKPATWDDELEGYWEPKLIINPRYLEVEYHARTKLLNPNYQPSDQKNFHLELDKELSISAIGIEVYQQTKGSLFDNIIVTSDKWKADALVEEFTDKSELERLREDYVRLQLQ